MDILRSWIRTPHPPTVHTTEGISRLRPRGNWSCLEFRCSHSDPHPRFLRIQILEPNPEPQPATPNPRPQVWDKGESEGSRNGLWCRSAGFSRKILTSWRAFLELSIVGYDGYETCSYSGFQEF